MLRILAIVGDAEASAHLRSSVVGAAHLEFVRDARDLVKHAKRGWPDVIVVGSREATEVDVRVTVRQILERWPATRVYLISHLNGPDMRALVRVQYLDLTDVIILGANTAGMTRDMLLKVDEGRTADQIVRRLVCTISPKWLQPYVDWCATHARPARLTVQSLAQVGQMRRETFARKLKARGICSPNELIAWILLLRVVARMSGSRSSLASIARDLGLPSSASLANLFVCWTGKTATHARTQGLDKFAQHAVRRIFGSRRTQSRHPRPTRSSPRRRAAASR